ncbi:Bacteriophage lambda NinG [uncultured Caudovirales phage]|uniref:Protein ninG n=1 Tax=uncultured Caudovirales phage TaxID=2100421 RepID=A0A6J5LBW1_9CAUD|nr:Bacteriophage lambda NinG [uncultured Caudovirales phage]
MPKLKTCKSCKAKFEPAKPLQSVCNPKCAFDHAQNLKAKRAQDTAKKERKELRKALDAIKPRVIWMREAQAAFNAYIRARDADLPCISCGQHRNSYDAGHYRTTAAAPELRFNEVNVHKQCVQCNQHLHGNLIEYRIGLVSRIGTDMAEWLEGKHDPKHYTVDDLKSIKELYKFKLKELKRTII